MTRPGLKVAGLILAGASGGVAAYEMMVPLLSQSPRLAAGGGAASPLAGAAQPAAAGAIPGLREAGRSHASSAALLLPGEIELGLPVLQLRSGPRKRLLQLCARKVLLRLEIGAPLLFQLPLRLATVGLPLRKARRQLWP